jgi:hypothetical protein
VAETASPQSAATGQAVVKQASVFYPAAAVARATENAQKHAWAAAIRDSVVAAARPWMKLSDEQLWDLMFSNSIKRSWMVWSNGHCPACKKAVPMYEWRPAALVRPWKMQCPHCKGLFPKNDFAKFYRSGLNEQGIFEPARADRSLLFNAEHPEPNDPLRMFGVDDGDGYVEGTKRWRFIGAYLIYGQWKQAIVAGAKNLAAAYVVTGDPQYAHKAGVILDRVADLYPTFDFGREGVMYEGRPSHGYVSTWHDAAVEVRELAMAYDEVFEALARDQSLVAFLAAKARQHKLANPKASFADVQRNIEERILRDTLANRRKIESNYPSTDLTLTVIHAVLGWPHNREEVTAMVDAMIRRATAVDGVTGEKGLDGYGTIGPHCIADLLGWFSRADADFVRNALRRNPQLHAMYRFHLDTWCLGHYYPRTGDTGSFAARNNHYAGVSFTSNPGIGPSAYALLWDLCQATGDKDFARLVHAANGNRVEGLPYDLFAAAPEALQQDLRTVIAEAGPAVRLQSVNKPKWCLAILRSGSGASERALWLDYDSGFAHGHADGMNLGLFAKGMDLLPDFGYPPVQYGGWGAPRAVWYTLSIAHNTVVVDGANLRSGSGTSTLWADGDQFRAIRASAPKMVGGKQFERTAMLIDISATDSYVVDIVRVVGGKEHVKFVHSGFGQVTPQGLSLKPAEPYGRSAQMRNYRKDSSPPPVWSVDWTIEDRFKYLPPGKEVRLRYTDLTTDAEAILAEAWVSDAMFEKTSEAWVPRALVCRRGPQAPLASTFVSVLDPYEKQPNVTSVRRLGLETADGKPLSEANVALEIRLADGRRDVVIATDVENPLGLTPAAVPGQIVVQKGASIRLDGQLAVVRFEATGKPQRMVICLGKSLTAGQTAVRANISTELVEVALGPGGAKVLHGAVEGVQVTE